MKHRRNMLAAETILRTKCPSLTSTTLPLPRLPESTSITAAILPKSAAKRDSSRTSHVVQCSVLTGYAPFVFPDLLNDDTNYHDYCSIITRRYGIFNSIQMKRM